jgi:hypothetical protein
MFEKINKVVDERYLDGDHITLYDKDGVHHYKTNITEKDLFGEKFLVEEE